MLGWVPKRVLLASKNWPWTPLPICAGPAKEDSQQQSLRPWWTAKDHDATVWIKMNWLPSLHTLLEVSTSSIQSNVLKEGPLGLYIEVRKNEPPQSILCRSISKPSYWVIVCLRPFSVECWNLISKSGSLEPLRLVQHWRGAYEQEPNNFQSISE